MLRRRPREPAASGRPFSAPSQATPYDAVPYPGAAFAQTHPDRLATLVALFGGRPAAVASCRVLELGCGDGGNLIPMAYAMPEASLHGVDLSAAAVGRAQETAATLGLDNVRFDVADLAALDPGTLGRFDHVIAHGVYSWIPAPAREALLALCGACLERDGAAFVSFNALPGGRLRQALADAMRFHARDAPTPERRIALARAMARTLGEHEAVRRALGPQIDAALERDDHGLFHDDLAEANEPFTIAAFAGDAARHGLRYLCDAELGECAVGAPRELTAGLASLGGDRIAREQYYDLLRMRMFRQAVLVRKDARADGEPRPAAIAGLRARSDAVAAPAGRRSGEMRFARPSGASIRTREPALHAMLEALAARWPAPMAGDELIALGGEDPARGAAIALDACRAGMVGLHAWEPPAAAEAGERPLASALARLQAQTGAATVTTLRHDVVAIEDDRSRRLLGLLDGTRDRSALAEALGLGRHDQARLDERLAQLATLGLILLR